MSTSDKLTKYRQKIKQTLSKNKQKSPEIPKQTRFNIMIGQQSDYIAEKQKKIQKSSKSLLGVYGDLRQKIYQPPNDQQVVSKSRELKNQRQIERTKSTSQLKKSNSQRGRQMNMKNSKGWKRDQYYMLNNPKTKYQDDNTQRTVKKLFEQNILPGYLLGNANYCQMQVKSLMEQNKILILELKKKETQINYLEQQLKLSSNKIPTPRFNQEMNLLFRQNELLKKSSDMQQTTLIEQIAQLNEEIKIKENDWEEKFTLIRKLNLREMQEARKQWAIKEQRLEILIEELKKVIKQKDNTLQTKQLEVSNEKKFHFNDIQQMENKIKGLIEQNASQKQQIHQKWQQKFVKAEEQWLKKIQQMQYNYTVRENKHLSMIEEKNRHISVLQQQINALKHQKESQAIQFAEQKARILCQQQIKCLKIKEKFTDELNKNNHLSNRQTKIVKKSLQNISQEQNHRIRELQQLLEVKNNQINSLFQQIELLREEKKLETQQHLKKVKEMQENRQNLIKQHNQQIQRVKQKMAIKNQQDYNIIEGSYSDKLGQKKRQLIDKKQEVKNLREKVGNERKQRQLKREEGLNEIIEMKIQLSNLKSELKNNEQVQQKVLRQKNIQIQQVQSMMETERKQFQTQNRLSQDKIKKFQKMIEQKDKEIGELQKSFWTMKLYHKNQVQSSKESNEILLKQMQEEIKKLKQQVAYQKKVNLKDKQMIEQEKAYYSNKIKELKNQKEKSFQQMLNQIITESSTLKEQNATLVHKLQTCTKEFETYRQLWNETIINEKMLNLDVQLSSKLRQQGSDKQELLIQCHKKQIEAHYQPKIRQLLEQLEEKNTILEDMKINYHQLEKKFQLFLESEEHKTKLQQKIFQLGREHSQMASLLKLQTLPHSLSE